MSKLFYWSAGARVKASAQAVGEEVERITGGCDSITIDQYLTHAKDPSSPLHNTITWDKNTAAMEWNKQEAAHVLRTLMYKKIETEEPKHFMYNTRETVGEYTKTTVVLKNLTMRATILQNALKELKACVDKYEGITDMLGLRNDILDVIKKWEHANETNSLHCTDVQSM